MIAAAPEKPAKNLPLTERQRAILDFIREKSSERGYAPTVREIGLKFGIRSPNGVVVHLDALIKKGFLKRAHNTSRGLTVTDGPEKDERVRLLKIIATWPTDLLRDVVECT